MEVKIQPPPPEAAVGMGNEFSRTTFIFKYFQGLDFAAFKFKDFQGPGGTLWLNQVHLENGWQNGVDGDG